MGERTNIVLLEFFVDNVKIDKHVKNDIPGFSVGQLCVSFKFLDFPPMHVNEEHPPSGQSNSQPVFRSGRSGLFSVPDMSTVTPDMLQIYIHVILKLPPTYTPCNVLVGQTVVNITHDFASIIAEAKMYPAKIPVTRTLRDSFLIANENKKLVGIISVFIRSSCFGNMIVQQFKRSNPQASVVGAEDSDGSPIPTLPGRVDIPPCSTQPFMPWWPEISPCMTRGTTDDLSENEIQQIAETFLKNNPELPSGLLESLKEGIRSGVRRLPKCVAECAVCPATRASRHGVDVQSAPTSRGVCGGGQTSSDGVCHGDTSQDIYSGDQTVSICPAIKNAIGNALQPLIATGQTPKKVFVKVEDDVCKEGEVCACLNKPCKKHKKKREEEFDEIGTEVNGTFLAIRVPKSKKPSKEKRELQHLAAKYGYVRPPVNPCTCKTDVCTCEAGAGSVRVRHHRRHKERQGPTRDVPVNVYGTHSDTSWLTVIARGPPPPKLKTAPYVPHSRDADPDNDVFSLKIGTKLEPDCEPKRPKLELLLRTPKRTDGTGTATIDTQYDPSDLPPGAEPKGKGGKGGKGKKGKKKGKKGKKGKKKKKK